MTPQQHLHVVGAGLIGGSAALAAAASGWTVTVEDRDQTAAEDIRRRCGELAARRGSRADGPTASHAVAAEPDVVLVAVPPAAVASVVAAALRRHVRATVTDTASVKARPLADLATLGIATDRFVPGHPLAGSELSGAAAARPDLFAGRSWVVCGAGAETRRIEQLELLVRAVGATPLRASVDEHDAALAITSHLPQVVASALAAVVADRAGESDAATLDLLQVVGPALLEMTRVAGSPPELWAEIARANAGHLRDAVAALTTVLVSYTDAFFDADAAAAATLALVDRGGRARRRLAAKHPRLTTAGAPRATSVPRLGGSGADDWAWVEVVVADEPGALASLFARAAELGVNIEDLHVDHAPHSSTGLVTLAVRAADAERLRASL